MDWQKLLCCKRIDDTPKDVDPDDSRSPFEHDLDIVTFSNAFRRLSRKTQVHPFSENAHTHTRLTHSLEVASVGRSLGQQLAANIQDKLPKKTTAADLGALVQAACLAHDIGNPPFGHAGEDVLSDWFQHEGSIYLGNLKPNYKDDILRFEGNAQGLRILTQTENYLFKGGLRLTYGTLAAFMKYPWCSSATKEEDNGKFGAYLSEATILKTIATRTGLVSKGKNRWCRHPLAFLTEAADDICYATIDLEDAVDLGLLSFKEVQSVYLKGLGDDERRRALSRLDKTDSNSAKFSKLRGPVFSSLITAAVEGFMSHYDTIMDGSFEGHFLDLLDKTSPAYKVINKAKETGPERIYTAKLKGEVEMGCYAALGCILNAFCKAAIEKAHQVNNGDEASISGISKLVLRYMINHVPSKKNDHGIIWTEYECLRRTLDYVSGMTDDYAWSLAAKLQGVTSIR